MSRTYVDEMKQQSRLKLQDFIRRHVLSRKDPKDVRVVCFPGAEKTGEEAIEVKEVYDPLGIPRKNVVGLECEEAPYKRLVKAKLGIRTEQMLDSEFFAQTNERFDIVTLDYKGMQTEERLNTIHTLVQKRILADHAVLTTVYAAVREPAKLQDSYALTAALSTTTTRDKKNRRAVMEKLQQGDIEGALDAINIDMREGISARLTNCLQIGKYPLISDFKRVHWTPKPIMDILDRAIALGPEETSRRSHKLSKLAGDVDRVLFHAAKGFVNTLQPHTLAHDRIFLDIYDNAQIRQLWTMIQNQLHIAARLGRTDYAQPLQGVDSNHYAQFAYELSRAFGGNLGRPYRIESVERYLYTSNKGTNMAMDIMAVGSKAEWWTSADIAFHVVDGKVETNPFKLNTRDFAMEVTKASQNVPSMLRDFPERIYLGSSLRRLPKITKEQAIEMLQSGRKPAEIAAEYRGFSIGQLSAYKAHCTMDTYKKGAQTPETV